MSKGGPTSPCGLAPPGCREASPGAAQLLGVSRRGLIDRLMHLHVRADRARVLQALERVGRGQEETLALQFQPKERRRIAARSPQPRQPRVSGAGDPLGDRPGDTLV